MNIEQNLDLIRPLTWKEVFDLWQQGEAHQQAWIEHYKRHGFGSWAEWRSSHIEPLGLANLNWNLHQILNPAATVPQFLGGPFKGWIDKYYPNGQAITFGQLAKNLEFRNHDRVLAIMNGFPAETTITAVRTAAGIVVVEGMHRCLALSLMAQRNAAPKTTMMLALADYEGELPIVGKGD